MNIINVTVCIPSFQRDDLLTDALNSFPQLIRKLREFHINLSVYVYRQSYDNISTHILPHMRHHLHVETVRHEVVPIGAIVGKAARFAVEKFNPDILILSDDDILISRNDDLLPEYLASVFAQMLYQNIDIVSAKMDVLEYLKYVPFPSKEEMYVPFKERFIALNCRSRYCDTGHLSVDILLSLQMDKITVGEDLWLFIKAATLQMRCRLVYGLNGWLHLPHMNENREKDSVGEGGFAALAAMMTGESVNEGNKYSVVEKATGTHVQAVIRQVFDPRMFEPGYETPFLNPLHPEFESLLPRFHLDLDTLYLLCDGQDV